MKRALVALALVVTPAAASVITDAEYSICASCAPFVLVHDPSPWPFALGQSFGNTAQFGTLTGITDGSIIELVEEPGRYPLSIVQWTVKFSGQTFTFPDNTGSGVFSIGNSDPNIYADNIVVMWLRDVPGGPIVQSEVMHLENILFMPPSVPEPSTWALLLVGFAFLGMREIWPSSKTHG